MTSSRPNRIELLLIGLIALAAALLSACRGVSSDTPAAKAGADPDAITLTINDPGAASPAYAALGIFRNEIERLSQGAITVEVVTGSDGVTEESLAEEVVDGTLDMGVIRTGVWSSAGITSLRTLHAPFLVESDEQLAAIARDADLVQRLFAGFERAGVHGLVMWPDELRHFFSFTDPILTVADVEGRTIRAITTQTDEMMRALGSTPVNVSYNEFSTGVADGSITAVDAGFFSADYSMPAPAIATANLALYPKVMSLVVNGGLWAGLDEGQRAILAQAADNTRERVIAGRRSDVEGAEHYCASGGAVVLADADAIEAFRAAVAPMYAAIARDASAAGVLADIQALAAQPAAAATACDGRPEPIDPNDFASIQPSAGALPNGVYRYEVTAADVVAAGLPAYEAGVNAGVYTWTLRDGHWRVDYPYDIPTDPNGIYVADEGIYEVHGDLLYMAITFFAEHYHAPYVLTLRWTEGDDGSLKFEYVGGDESIRRWDVADYTSAPWVRIADA